MIIIFYSGYRKDIEDKNKAISSLLIPLTEQYLFFFLKKLRACKHLFKIYFYVCGVI